jgi:RNA polymerase sigma-70 factor (ECF subfamily)
MMLVERYQPAMLRIALMYVSTRAVAEDVVQDAWVGVLKGLDRFEGRSSLRTWIFRILVNTAKTRGQREARSVPFSSVWAADPEFEPSVDPDRFLPLGHPGSPGRWAEPPAGWASTPEERLLSKETLAEVSRAIDALPPNQREVITMRDVLGWTSRTSVTPSTSPRPISGCSCIAHARRSVARSRATSDRRGSRTS